VRIAHHDDPDQLLEVYKAWQTFDRQVPREIPLIKWVEEACTQVFGCAFHALTDEQHNTWKTARTFILSVGLEYFLKDAQPMPTQPLPADEGEDYDTSDVPEHPNVDDVIYGERIASQTLPEQPLGAPDEPRGH
jgi:hypothetical protein